MHWNMQRNALLENAFCPPGTAECDFVECHQNDFCRTGTFVSADFDFCSVVYKGLALLAEVSTKRGSYLIENANLN
jgi:hypothetical protein